MNDIISTLEKLFAVQTEEKEMTEKLIETIDNNDTAKLVGIDNKFNSVLKVEELTTLELRKLMEEHNYNNFKEFLNDIKDLKIRKSVENLINNLIKLQEETIRKMQLFQSLSKIGMDTAASYTKALVRTVDFLV